MVDGSLREVITSGERAFEGIGGEAAETTVRLLGGVAEVDVERSGSSPKLVASLGAWPAKKASSIVGSTAGAGVVGAGASGDVGPAAALGASVRRRGLVVQAGVAVA